MQPTLKATRTMRPGFFRRTFATTTPTPSSWSTGPSPPRLPKEEQEIFEKLQKQSTGAFSTPRSATSPTDPSPPTKNPTSADLPDALKSYPQAEHSSSSSSSSSGDEAKDMLAQLRERAQLAAKGDGEELHPNVRRGAPPEFEGERNPKTGEVGGPKNDPLRWGGEADWSYNGRVTDF
ncbi:hypothetical protein MBLNU230_g1017t1 [Neophaeotheca triangularis]